MNAWHWLTLVCLFQAVQGLGVQSCTNNIALVFSVYDKISNIFNVIVVVYMYNQDTGNGYIILSCQTQ